VCYTYFLLQLCAKATQHTPPYTPTHPHKRTHKPPPALMEALDYRLTDTDPAAARERLGAGSSDDDALISFGNFLLFVKGN